MSDEGLVTAPRTGPKHHPPAVWLKAHNTYVRGEGFLRDISKRFGIPLATLQSRAKAKKWSIYRKRYLDSKRIEPLDSQPLPPVAQPAQPISAQSAQTKSDSPGPIEAKAAPAEHAAAQTSQATATPAAQPTDPVRVEPQTQPRPIEQVIHQPPTPPAVADPRAPTAPRKHTIVWTQGVPTPQPARPLAATPATTKPEAAPPAVDDPEPEPQDQEDHWEPGF